MKGFTAFLGFLLACVASAGSIAVQNAYPCDRLGNPIQPALGETFFMAANLMVDPGSGSTYRVRFDLPYESRTTPDLSFAGSPTIVWGPYFARMEGPIPMKVSILSANAAVPFTIEISPKLPTVGVEYFAAQGLTGFVSATATLTSGTSASLQWYAPLPSSGGFQQVFSAVKQGSQIVSTPFSQPVASSSKALTAAVSFQTSASSSRVNSTILRKATFDSYRVLPAVASVWLRAETLIEVKSADVNAFVLRTLPKNYRTAMKPYEAAQMLFQAVVAHTQYVTTTARPDAIQALRTGQGDCGFFSAEFVAACRNIGIPARTVTGMTIGDSQWHVWAEFYIPAYGWVPADPSYCDGLCPDGSLPLYFGTIPDLNSRAVISYGFDHICGKTSMAILQSPALVVSGSTKVGSVQAACGLSVMATN